MSTPARRVTRKTTAAREVTPVATDTAYAPPSAATRKKSREQSELPALQNKTSSAYGVAGRTQLPETTNPNQDQSFENVFGNERSKAQNEAAAAQDAHAGPSKSAKGKGKGKAKKTQAVAPADDASDRASHASQTSNMPPSIQTRGHDPSGYGRASHASHASNLSNVGLSGRRTFASGYGSRASQASNLPSIRPAGRRPSTIEETVGDWNDGGLKVGESSQMANMTTQLAADADDSNSRHSYHFDTSDSTDSSHSGSVPPTHRPSVLVRLLKQIYKHGGIIAIILWSTLFTWYFTAAFTNPTSVEGYGTLDHVALSPLHPKAIKGQIREWWTGKPNDGYPEDVLGTVKELKSRMEHYRNGVTEVSTWTYILKETAPRWLIVRKSRGGDIELPDDFWQALKAKTAHDLGFSDSESMWKQFLETNDAYLRQLIEDGAEKGLEAKIADHAVVDADTLKGDVQKTYQDLMAEMQETKDYLEWRIGMTEEKVRATALDVATNVARDVVEKAVKQLDSRTLYSLEAGNIMASMHDTMTSVNYISQALGAMVDPTKSSATYRADRRDKQSWLGWYFMSMFSFPNPPVAALLPWSEAADCWCAKATSQVRPEDLDPLWKGEGEPPRAPMTQLAVRAPRTFYPGRMIVENIPKMGTLASERSPKDVELWIPVADADKRAALWRDVIRHDVKRGYQYALRELGRDEADSWVAKARGDLPQEYVRVATMRYALGDVNHVQSVAPTVDLLARRIPTDRVVVRVTDNWGSPDATCLYRVRVTGTLLGDTEAETRTAEGSGVPIVTLTGRRVE